MQGPAFLFNGDADGIISQHMLWMHGLRPSLRITGMKREIGLMARLPETFAGDVYALDISLKSNAAAAMAFLARPGGRLTWFDHHESGDPPTSDRFTAHIHMARGQCTALITCRALGHAYELWAIAAAYGDNVTASAEALAQKAGTTPEDREALGRLGELLNYNAYGESEDALHAPAALAAGLEGYTHPLTYFRESGLFEPLAEQLRSDEAESAALAPWHRHAGATVYRVPDRPWARRYGATWMNRLVRQQPEQGFAVFQERRQGGYLVSLRAPQQGPRATWDAGRFAGAYPTGGGRLQAAGINALPETLFETCAEAFLREMR